MPNDPNDVTALLLEWSQGNQAARDALMPLVYDELRKTARGYLANERSGHTLQTTALVHETYLRLVQQKKVSWEKRKQFFAFAAKVMRRILIDHARSRGRQKRGADAVPIPLDPAPIWDLGDRQDLDRETVLQLDDALSRLEEIQPAWSRVVELRFFSGLTVAEIADLEGVSAPTVKRNWKRARLWLSRHLKTP